MIIPAIAIAARMAAALSTEVGPIRAAIVRNVDCKVKRIALLGLPVAAVGPPALSSPIMESG
jgi:hypothetical protein